MPAVRLITRWWALGPRCYLEILAPTGPQAPDGGCLVPACPQRREPRILTYCLRSARPLSQLAQIAEAAGAHDALVASNGRVTPEGVRLNWQWVAPVFDAFGLAFPFFIDWLDSPHPAATAQGQGERASCTTSQWDTRERRDLLRTLTEMGTPIDTYTAAAIEFRVQLAYAAGAVAL